MTNADWTTSSYKLTHTNASVVPSSKELIGSAPININALLDISKAVSLGSEGILLASGVVKSLEPRKVLLDLIKGL